MNLTKKYSLMLTNFVASNLNNKTDLELLKIQYGIEVFLLNSYKIPIVFLTSYLLGIFKYTIVSFISFSLLRTFAAGLHAKNGFSCLFSSIVVFIGIPYLSFILSIDLYCKAILSVICFVLVILYSPADTEEKPYVSRKLRRNLKLLSCLSVLTISIIALFFSKSVFSNIILFSIFIECILITPLSYKILGRRYRNYEI